jgi:hypothetical protein
MGGARSMRGSSEAWAGAGINKGASRMGGNKEHRKEQRPRERARN